MFLRCDRVEEILGEEQVVRILINCYVFKKKNKQRRMMEKESNRSES